MEVLFYVLLSIAILMAVVFVVFSNGQKGFLSLSLKSIASFCFIILAMYIMFTKGASVAACLFVAGFVASGFGDIILALPDMPELNKKAQLITLIGGLCFAVAHIFYISAMIVLFGFKWWIILCAIALGAIFCWGNKAVGKLNYGKLNAGMPVYSVFVSMVVGVSIFVLTTGANLTGSILLLLGFILFWLSDIVLMHIYFGNKPDKNKFLYYFNLSFYYAAQILIAYSLVFLL